MPECTIATFSLRQYTNKQARGLVVLVLVGQVSAVVRYMYASSFK